VQSRATVMIGTDGLISQPAPIRGSRPDCSRGESQLAGPLLSPSNGQRYRCGARTARLRCFWVALPALLSLTASRRFALLPGLLPASRKWAAWRMFSGSGQSCCETFPIREIVRDIPDQGNTFQASSPSSYQAASPQAREMKKP
jgi:hypothetical protein